MNGNLTEGQGDWHWKNGVRARKNRYSPVVSNGVSVSILDIPIQKVVANIGASTLHPLYGYWPIGDVEVVLAEFCRICRSFPVKLLCNITPKLGRIIQGLSIKFPILVHAGHIGRPTYSRIWFINRFLRWHFSAHLYFFTPKKINKMSYHNTTYYPKNVQFTWMSLKINDEVDKSTATRSHKKKLHT